MISVHGTWMGHDRDHASDLSPEVVENAHVLIERVNVVLARAATDDVFPAEDIRTGNAVASGWRPRAVNEATGTRARRAGTSSVARSTCAITCPDRPLARWCLRNREVLEAAGLWMEDPQWTPSWVHLQSVPPGSGDRIFVPSTSPALAAKLPERGWCRNSGHQCPRRIPESLRHGGGRSRTGENSYGDQEQRRARATADHGTRETIDGDSQARRHRSGGGKAADAAEGARVRPRQHRRGFRRRDRGGGPGASRRARGWSRTASSARAHGRRWGCPGRSRSRTPFPASPSRRSHGCFPTRRSATSSGISRRC